MLLVIHNLPSNIKYAEIKSLIQTKCGLDEIILDHLANEGRYKKVTVGLADDGDAAILVRKINGLYVAGNQLYVEDVRQKKASEQPYRSTRNLLEEASLNNYKPFQANQWSNNNVQSVPQRDYSNKDNSQSSSAQAPLGFQGNSGFQGIQQNPAMVNMDPMAFMMNYNMANMGVGGIYTMPTFQPEKNYLGYGAQQQVTSMMPQMAEVQPQLEPRFSFGSVTNQQDVQSWNVNNNRSDSMQNSSFGDRQRAYSPPRDQRSDDFDRGASRWDRSKNEIESRFSRQRSRSPRNNRDAHDSYNNRSPNNYNSNRFEEQFGGFTREQNSNFNNYSTPNQDLNIFGSHVKEQQHENPSSRWDKPPYPKNIQRGSPQQERFMGAPQQFTGAPQQFTGGYRREQPHGATKRFASRWESDNPPPKRVAPSVKPFKNANNKFNAPGAQRKSPFKGPQFKGHEQPKKQFRSDIPNQPMQRPIRPKAPFQHPSLNAPKPPQLRPTKSDMSVRPMSAQFWKKEQRKRTSSAIAITKQMVAKIDLDRNPLKDKKEEIFKLLRDKVKVLIDGMVGTNLLTSDIIARLRQLHPEADDYKFVYTTLEDEKYPTEILSAVKESEANYQRQHTDLEPRKIMPKDKKLNADMKRMRKLEVTDEKLYTLPEAEQKALDKEVDHIVDLFMGECLHPADNEDEKYVCEQIADVASDEFRKMVRLLVTKRLLDVKTSLVLRINVHDKLPRDSLENFLQDYNIISLKKSAAKKLPNFYIAVCGSYEAFDKLCAIGRTTIDGIPVTFKSMHLAGPAKINKKSASDLRRRYIDRQIDRSGENILKPAQNTKTVKKEVVETVDENQTVEVEPTADKKNVTAEVENGNVKGATVECKIEAKPSVSGKNETGPGETKTCPDVSEMGHVENDDWGEGGVPWSDNDGPGGNAEDQDEDNIDEDDLEDY